MLKNIQNNLLLKYPIIWNTKFVPMLLIGVLFHVIFFALGYYDGTIDFSNQTNVDINVSATLFGILISIIITILWLVNYFKNNSLKTFYTKSNYSLFYEWIQVFIICLLLISFYVPFHIGEQLHQKSYFSLEETKARCKTISTADIFIDGYFKRTEVDSLASNLVDSLGNKTHKNFDARATKKDYEVDVVEVIQDDTQLVYYDYILFKNKKYDEYSLLNRSIYEFSIFDKKQDSIHEFEVKNWLYEDNSFAVKNLLNTYLGLLKEHKLATNLDLNKWFEITYKKPEFVDFLYIIPYLEEYETENSFSGIYQYNPEGYRDNDSKYSKYFIQQDVLKHKYDLVSKAHSNPYFEFEAILGFLYGALAFSLLIFSFRVTSGKSWLIALVTVGVLNIVFGVIAAVSSSEYIYFYLILFSILGVIGYFFRVYFKKKSIQWSTISLNLFLWTFALIIPIVYFLILDSYRKERRYYEDYNSPEFNWLNTHIVEMFTLNFIIAFVVLFIMSLVIRKWKGIAEE